MTRQHYRTIGLVAGAGLSMLLAGCSDPISQRLINRRWDNIAGTARTFRDIEARQPESMAWVLGSLRDQCKRDVANTGENPGRVARLAQQDIDRWAERQPAYREEIKRQLWGNPDNIRRTAPELAW